MLDEQTARERYSIAWDIIRKTWVMMASAGAGIIVMSLVTSLWWPVEPLSSSADHWARPLTITGVWFLPISTALPVGYFADLVAWLVTHRLLRLPWRIVINFGIGIAIGAWFARGPASRLGIWDAVLGLALVGCAMVWGHLTMLAIGRGRVERARTQGKSA